MYLSDRWLDYELLDAGDGDKLERWGDVILQRPDPQAIWPHGPWPKPDARYIRSASGGGHWQINRPYPRQWVIHYPGIQAPLSFIIEPTGFKHTGLFPEQAANWDYCTERIVTARLAGREVRVLNLFAYTGAASVACSAAGATEVVHVDASKGMNARARENLAESGLKDKVVRCLADDVQKFVEREIRRGHKYEGIIMDPPSYGRGPSGELWKLEDALYDLIAKTSQLLSDQPLFFLVNSYTTGLAPLVLRDILGLAIRPRHGGQVEAEELGLPATQRELILPCGATGRWAP